MSEALICMYSSLLPAPIVQKSTPVRKHNLARWWLGCLAPALSLPQSIRPENIHVSNVEGSMEYWCSKFTPTSWMSDHTNSLNNECTSNCVLSERRGDDLWEHIHLHVPIYLITSTLLPKDVYIHVIKVTVDCGSMMVSNNIDYVGSVLG